GELPAGAADEWRARLTPHEDRLGPPHVAELAWLDGVLAAARGEPDALTAARARLSALGGGAGGRAALSLPRPGGDADVPAVARMLDASLEAFGAALRGDTRGAGERLAELERRRAEHGWAKAPAQWHPYLTGL